ncbi:MAG: class I SAM-dependent methyltransferase [Candidatus Thorarchaeota archaeon]|jgi:SAM-dependent methyltransferase
MDAFLKANRELWDKLASIHHKSEFYDVDGFLKGNQTLDPIELEELPDLSGKKLLHLQCHFGMDTLSLARLGAEVTGVDFSSEAIDLAKALNKSAGLDAKFICANVYDIPEVLNEKFDIVFTSGGVIMWLPDLEKWAEVISSSLKPGGMFYIREFHPFSYIFDDRDEVKDLRVHYPYFQGKAPMEFEDDGTYASDEKTGKMKTYEWNHPISVILNSLIRSGLRIDHFNEFPVTGYKALPFMIEKEKGKWVLPDNEDKVPLMFSIKASKTQ